MFISAIKKKLIAICLEMELNVVPSQYIFTGQGYVQHAGVVWNGIHCLRYNMYVNPEGKNLSEEILYAYGRSFRQRADIIPLDIS